MKSIALKIVWLGWAASVAWSAQAQTAAPSAQQMIEQLQAPAPGSARTRGLRNLTVESTHSAASDGKEAPTQASTTSAAPSGSGQTAPQAKPSLSLLIQFDFNSALIRPESQQALLNLSQALNSPELSPSKFAVEGHTDAKGLAAYNQKLSQQRAEAVQSFLVKNGVTASRLLAAGKGSTQLANADNPLAAENRRVRIVNLD